MSVKNNIVLIPYWIPEILKRKGLELKDCLDFPKLKPLLSLNDLVSFATLQEYYGKLTGAEEPSSLIWIWSASIPKDQPELSKYLWDTVSTISMDQTFKNEIETRLFCEGSKLDQYPEPYAVQHLAPEVGGIVIYPGHFILEENSKPVHQKALVVSILKVLYVYNAYNEMCKTSLFKKYLELLAGK